MIAEKDKQLDGTEELIEKASTEGAQMHTKWRGDRGNPFLFRAVSIRTIRSMERK